MVNQTQCLHARDAPAAGGEQERMDNKGPVGKVAEQAVGAWGKGRDRPLPTAPPSESPHLPNYKVKKSKKNSQ